MRWRIVEAKRREEYGGGRRGMRGNEQGRRVGRGGGESEQGRKWLGRGIRRERKSLARGEKYGREKDREREWRRGSRRKRRCGERVEERIKGGRWR